MENTKGFGVIDLFVVFVVVSVMLSGVFLS